VLVAGRPATAHLAHDRKHDRDGAVAPLGVEPRVLRSPLFARVATDSSFQVGVAAVVEQAWMRAWKEAQAP
jgi:hypothetical protein